MRGVGRVIVGQGMRGGRRGPCRTRVRGWWGIGGVPVGQGMKGVGGVPVGQGLGVGGG